MGVVAIPTSMTCSCIFIISSKGCWLWNKYDVSRNFLIVALLNQMQDSACVGGVL